MFASNAFALMPNWLLFAELAVLALVAGYFLIGACNAAGAEPPSFTKAVLISVFGAAGAFFTFDFLGYQLVMHTLDMTHLALPQGFGYLDWLDEPMALKWRAMGLVPVLRYLPLLFAVIVAGVFYVLALRDSWRIVLVILLMQGSLTAITSVVLGYALSNITHKLTPKETRVAHDKHPTTTSMKTPPAKHREAPSKIDDSAAKPTSFEEAVRNYGWRGGKFAEKMHEFGDWFHEHTKGLVDPIDEAAAPYTEHLPPVLQEFLRDGGWLLVIAAVTVVFLLWVRSLTRRFRKATRRKQRLQKKAKQHIEIDLEEVGEATNEAAKQVTVRDFPGRLRVVIMAPAASYVGDLLPEMAESLLDYIRPGLGAVYENDTPRVLVWPRFNSEGKFLDFVQKAVRIPEERGRKTPWLVTAGTTHLGRQRVYLCVATFLDRPGYMREIRVTQDKWADLFSVAKAVE